MNAIATIDLRQRFHSEATTGRGSLGTARMGKYFLATLALVFLSLISELALAAFSADVPREKYQEGDLIILTLSTDRQSQGSPDLTPLTANFEILGQSQSSQITQINGRLNVLISWRLEMLPKKTGKLTIPSLSLGSEKTKPISITVGKAKAPSNSPNDAADDNTKPLPELFLTLEADDNSPYVQQEVLLTLTIHHTRPLQQGQLSQLDLPNAVVTEIKEQTEDYKRIGGHRYRTLSVHYLVVPQKSGALTIDPIRLVAELGRNAGAGRGFQSRFFDRGDRRVASSDSLVLDVRPKPAAYPDDAAWLPAKSVTLTDDWSQTDGTAQVGEAITRSVSLNIQGQTARILPEITYESQPNAKIYADQSHTEEEATRRGTRSQRSFSLAIVPTAPGPLNLPAQTIYWWDVTEDRLESLELPGRSWTVAGAANQSTSPAQGTTAPTNTKKGSGAGLNTLTDRDGQQNSGASPANRQSGNSTPTLSTPSASSPTWITAALAALLILWLITAALAWHFYRRQQITGAKDSKTKAKQDTKQALSHKKHWQKAKNAIHTCIDANAYGPLTQAIVQWARLHWHDQNINALGHVIRLCEGSALHAPLVALERYRYQSENQPAPNLAALTEALKAYKKPLPHKSSQASNAPGSPLLGPQGPHLAPLHPHKAAHPGASGNARTDNENSAA